MKARILIICLLGICSAGHVAAQSGQASTEERLRRLRQQITQSEQQLSETARAEQATMATLEDMNREMALREELIKNYQQRLLELSNESDSLEASAAGHEAQLDVLRRQYQHRAVHAYKYGRLHDLALILAAKSINEMLVRVRYLDRFTDQRRQKFEEVVTATARMKEQRAQLEEARQETQQLLQEAEAERRTLSGLRQSRQQVIGQLQSQRRDIQQDLKKKRTAATQFEAQLRSMVTGSRNLPSADPVNSAAYNSLTGSFKTNQGRLPWPAQGVVVEPYGEVINPVYGTSTPNPGILIATSPQAEVRAIFDGVVLGVSVVPEYGTYVAIQHGEYQSVYSNFSLTYIAEGDRVKAGQVIGRAGTEDQPKRAGIFFALFHGGEAFDPMPWMGAQ